jgi:hypothetical protein
MPVALQYFDSLETCRRDEQETFFAYVEEVKTS